MRFSDIPQLPYTNYSVSVPLDGLEDTLSRYTDRYDLDMSPDFQRGHVWSEEQKVKFLEYMFSGGHIPPIYFNHPGWQREYEGQMTLVDGKQRLSAILDFLKDKISIFGNNYYSQFEDRLPDINLVFSVGHFDSRTVLQWYVALNSGVPHTEEELDRVKELLANS